MVFKWECKWWKITKTRRKYNEMRKRSIEKTNSNINVQTELIVYLQTFSFHFQGIPLNARKSSNGVMIQNIDSIYWNTFDLHSNKGQKQHHLQKQNSHQNNHLIPIFVPQHTYHCKLNKINIKFVFGQINRRLIASCCF